MPLLTGGGSVVVGAVAIYVARQSHELAKQVRADEGTRDEAASRERYRDQLFKVVEPAVSAVIDYTNEVNTVHEVDTAELRKLRSAASSRLRLMRAVAVGQDRLIADVAWIRLGDITKHPLWQVQAYAAAGLAGLVAAAIEEDRNTGAVVAAIDELIEEAVSAYEETEALDGDGLA